jgi:starvation-inducible DNA-binding protein
MHGRIAKMNQMLNTTLSQDARDQVGSILNHALADEFALSSAARDYHWNVTGPHFRNLNEIFVEQYHQLDEWIERIAERARALGIAAQTGWTDLIKGTRFSPVAGTALNAAGMLESLMTMHERMVERLRADAEICATNGIQPIATGLLTELLEYHETAAWMLGELLADRERAQA